MSISFGSFDCIACILSYVFNVLYRIILYCIDVSFVHCLFIIVIIRLETCRKQQL